MSNRSRRSRKKGKQDKKHFLEGDSQMEMYKSIRKHPVPSTQVHGSDKKGKWNWRDELNPDD